MSRCTAFFVASIVLIAGTTGAFAENGDYFVADVVYGHKDGMALTFDVFKPEGNANGAGVLFMVSGGWVSRWAPPETYMPFFKPVLDKGFTVFAVRHGSSPIFKVPDARADVGRAVRFIRLHAGEYGVDAERLGVFGGSAGGHLSLMLGLDGDEGDTEAKDEVLRQSSAVAAVVAYFPPVDLREWVGPSDRFPALDFDAGLAESVSPILYVSSDDPPTLLVHGDSDTLVPISNSELIYAALKKAKVKTKFITIEGAGHGFGGDDAKRASEALVSWFEKHLTK